MVNPIPVGTKVIMEGFGIPYPIKGVKIREGLFKADEYDERLHNAAGSGPNGYFYYCTDNYFKPYDVKRKKTGFAKFISSLDERHTATPIERTK